MKDAQDLYDRLSTLQTDNPPQFRACRAALTRKRNGSEPELLCEVAFTEWTEDGHIRHPSFQGLREDKKPKDVTMEKPVAVKNGGSEKKKDGTDSMCLGVAISHPDRVIFEDTGDDEGPARGVLRGGRAVDAEGFRRASASACCAARKGPRAIVSISAVPAWGSGKTSRRFAGSTRASLTNISI